MSHREGSMRISAQRREDAKGKRMDELKRGLNPGGSGGEGEGVQR